MKKRKDFMAEFKREAVRLMESSGMLPPICVFCEPGLGESVKSRLRPVPECPRRLGFCPLRERHSPTAVYFHVFGIAKT